MWFWYVCCFIHLLLCSHRLTVVIIKISNMISYLFIAALLDCYCTDKGWMDKEAVSFSQRITLFSTRIQIRTPISLQLLKPPGNFTFQFNWVRERWRFAIDLFWIFPCKFSRLKCECEIARAEKGTGKDFRPLKLLKLDRREDTTGEVRLSEWVKLHHHFYFPEHVGGRWMTQKKFTSRSHQCLFS